jgi:hypothetical protein
MAAKIIGVMALKNVLKQGYPFLESIYSVLPVVDQLFIEDGNSSDGTKDILKEIAQNKKIKLFLGYNWAGSSKKGYAIRDAYNHVLKKAKERYKDKDDAYLMEVQANEIVHEDDYKSIRDLPVLYPQYNGFYLPYQFMVGNLVVNTNDWRLRILKANADPVCYGDAGEIYPKKELTFPRFLKTSGTATFRYMTRKLYYSHVHFKMAFFYHFAVLPKSIFRYTYIFPRSIINKISGHSKLYVGNKNYKNGNSIPSFITELASKNLPNNEFYFELADKLCKSGFKRMARKPVLVPYRENPKIMSGILNNGSYTVRNKLIESIKNLS